MFVGYSITVYQHDILCHYFSKATELVDVLEQDNDQNISLIISNYTNMHQLFIFIQNILEKRHDIMTSALTALL